MVKRIAICSILWLCLTAHATQTLVVREMFDGIGIIANATPGSFGTVSSGSWYKRAVGPSTSGSSIPQGFSADVRAAAFTAYWDLTIASNSAAATLGSLQFWIRPTTFGSGGFTAMGRLLSTDGTLFVAINFEPSTGKLWITDSGSHSVKSAALNLHTWYYFILDYQNVDALHVAWKASYKALTDVGFTLISNQASYSTGGKNVQKVQAENSGGFWNGRIGSVGLYAIGAIGDGVYPADLIDPVETNRTWYVNPSTGNDTNTGLSATNAWLTAAKLNAELSNNGVMGTLTPWKDGNGNVLGAMTGAQFKATNDAFGLVPNGDTVAIDTSGTPFVVDAQVAIGTYVPGCHLTAVGSSADTRAYKVLSAGGWSALAGTSKVYQSSDTEHYVVLWEDRKWLNHPVGANLAAVTNSLETTAGSYWTDGTKIYVHPFGDTNPGSDGKTYERSYLLGGDGNHAFTITGANCQISKLSVGGTAIVSETGNTNTSNENHYCIQATGSNNRVLDCFTYYGAKHTVGTLQGAASKGVIWERVQAEQSPPWLTNGQVSPFVIFDTATTNKVGALLSCTTLKNQGLVGSTNGTFDVSNPVFITHSGGSGQQWSDIYIDRCYFPSGLIGQTADSNVANGVTVTLTLLGVSGFFKSSFSQCYVDYGQMTTQPNGQLTARNCVVVPQRSPSSSVGDSLNGTMDIQGCTYDLSANTGTGTLALLTRTAAFTLTFRNNVFIGKSGQQFALTSQATSSDTITMDSNVYVLGSSLFVALSYNDGSTTSDRTLAQWQALGFDLGTVNSDPCLGANHRPYAKTPCWNVGSNLGALIDYSGKLFQSRRTAGAYEYDPPIILWP